MIRLFFLFLLINFAHADIVSFKVPGMTCESCSSHITSALSKINGIDPKTIEVDVTTKVVRFVYLKGKKISDEQRKNIQAELAKNVKAAGYEIVGDYSWSKN